MVCVLEAAECQEDALKTALKVAEQSRKESSNLSYRVNQVIEDPKKFILYETWNSAEEYQLQF